MTHSYTYSEISTLSTYDLTQIFSALMVINEITNPKSLKYAFNERSMYFIRSELYNRKTKKLRHTVP